MLGEAWFIKLIGAVLAVTGAVVHHMIVGGCEHDAARLRGDKPDRPHEDVINTSTTAIVPYRLLKQVPAEDVEVSSPRYTQSDQTLTEEEVP